MSLGEALGGRPMKDEHDRRIMAIACCVILSECCLIYGRRDWSPIKSGIGMVPVKLLPLLQE